VKGPHIVVAPHLLPAELLLRMRRENRAAALAFMDQSQVLRSVFSTIREGLLRAADSLNNSSFIDWSFNRTRLSTRTTATRDRASRRLGTTRHANHSTTANNRTGLHLRRTHQERQTLLTPRSWASTLLATQRRARDVAGGEVNDQRVTRASIRNRESEMASQICFSPLLRRYTLEEFWNLPDPEDRAQYELIGGILFFVPAPNPPYGDLASRINKILFRFLLANDNDGYVHHPHEAIWRSAEGSTYLEPDMMYVSTALRAQMGDKRTSADIVFEFLSCNSNTYNRTTKADTYLALGVRELWLVDPVTVTIEVRHAHQKENSPAWEVCIYPRGEQAKSRVLEGWEVSVTELFDGLVRPSDTDES